MSTDTLNRIEEAMDEEIDQETPDPVVPKPPTPWYITALTALWVVAMICAILSGMYYLGHSDGDEKGYLRGRKDTENLPIATGGITTGGLTVGTTGGQIFIGPVYHAEEVRSPFDAPDVPAPSDPPPSTVRIGVYTYTLEWRSSHDMPGLYGETNNSEKRIVLNAEQSPGDLRVTVLHEIVHGCTHIGTADGTLDLLNHEEPPIKAYTTLLVQVLHDNPKLVEWLRR